MHSRPSSDESQLHQQLEILWRTDPGLPLLEAAARIGRPEARLMAARVGAAVVRLEPSWPELCRGLMTLGTVTLHVDCRVGIHRKEVRLNDVGAADITAICRGEGTELRLLLSRWASGFAVCEGGVPGAPEGLHFYDRHGDSALRVLVSHQTHRAAWAKLVAAHRAVEQGAPLALEPLPLPPPATPPTVSAEALRAAWGGLSDARDFFRLLRSFNLTRAQAYQLVGPTFAVEISQNGVQELLERCSADNVPLAFALGNRAAIHVHNGTLECVSSAGPLTVIRDPGHTILLHRGRFASAWVVHRRGLEGLQTTVELLTEHGDVVGTLRPSDLQDWRWRRLTEHTLLRGAA